MKTLKERIMLAANFLKNDRSTLSSHVDLSQVTVGDLEAVAGVRFALMVVAEVLTGRVTGSNEQLFTAQANDLLRLAEVVCTKVEIRDFDTVDVGSPLIYLIKLLVRQYGSGKLMEVSTAYSWVLPPELKSDQEVSSMYSFVSI